MIIERLSHDFRSAFRGLWRAKGFAVAAVLTLALGIAGTTVMFTLIQGVLLRPLPVREQERLIVAWKVVPTSGSAAYPFGDREIEAVAEASQLLESAAGVTRNGVGRSVVTDGGVSSYANVGLVTGGFFDVLGVQPIVGRAFTRDDDKEGTENVIVISNGYWLRRYGGSPDVIGRDLVFEERPFRIVGVMPPDLDYPTGVEIWMTTKSVPTDGPFGDAARREVNLMGRLRPGITVEQATSEIIALNQRLEAQAPADGLRGLVPVVRSFVDVVVGDVRLTLIALFAAVGLVLLIAGANVANLLLMRGESRRGELAVRAALGAGRSRILSQVLAESVVLASAAGVCGFAVAWWSVPAIVRLVPDGLPRVEAIRVDGLVVLCSIAVVFMTGLASGLIPALSSLRLDLVSSLRSSGHGITGTSANRGRRALVVVQVALAVTVLTAAALLIRSVLKLQAIDLGMAAERLVLLELYLPPEKFTERPRHAQFLDDAIDQLEAVPVISRATPVNIPPFLDQGWDVPRISAAGQSEVEAAGNPSLNLESIHPSYFETLDIPILRGRAFTPADREGSPLVAVVSENVAEQLWPGQDPIGKRLKFGPVASSDEWRTVVGIAAPSRYRTLTVARPTLYLPAAQFQMTATLLVLRTTASLELLTSIAVDRMRTIDPDVRLMRASPFTELLDRPLARPRFNAFLLGIFALAAVMLSTVGLYAVMAAYVRQRDREIALRLALGATAGGVRRFVLAETVRLASLGALIGVAAAVAASRLLRGMLFEVGPLDPWATIGAALLLMAASALASYLPMRRATRLDAVAMLRAS
ncbi:MAG TPA: ABC transporter permease [Vicinamibacterales bacterium]|jgi:predicted permease